MFSAKVACRVIPITANSTRPREFAANGGVGSIWVSESQSCARARSNLISNWFAVRGGGSGARCVNASRTVCSKDAATTLISPSSGAGVRPSSGAAGLQTKLALGSHISCVPKPASYVCALASSPFASLHNKVAHGVCLAQSHRIDDHKKQRAAEREAAFAEGRKIRQLALEAEEQIGREGAQRKQEMQELNRLLLQSIKDHETMKAVEKIKDEVGLLARSSVRSLQALLSHVGL
ncbi:unnamed protein product [Dibothriocephalus latus]|uniref:Uncharacterized protein n=1 Tax=Dibothriocephalus latus TaxID=60516 RepID=A0A3P7LZT9_DIBLA|nr:unnamed protein product [Dibothriocephalus latus]